MSLYANLLNPNADAAASVSGAPVLYDTGERDDSAVKKEVNPGMPRQATIAVAELRRSPMCSTRLTIPQLTNVLDSQLCASSPSAGPK